MAPLPRPGRAAIPPARRNVDNASLLSPLAYDDDAASLNSSRSDQDTDSEDDELQLRARNSRELRAHDRIVLMQEEELDRLVTDQRREQERNKRQFSGGTNSLGLPNPFEKIEQILGRRNSTSGSSMTIQEDEVLDKGIGKGLDREPDEGGEADKLNRRSNRRMRRDERKRRLLEDAQHGEDGALMYEMEEGDMKEGSSTGESSEIDYDDGGSDGHANGQFGRHKSAMGHAKARGWKRWAFVWVLTTLGFAILVLAAWKATNAQRAAAAALLKASQGSTAIKDRLVSNGTALFAPTTIIISLDGFRADFLRRGITPRLNALAAQGVSPKHMLPSFPSVTFPNHWTLATGMYPEAHGLVGNSFWDPVSAAQFYYTDQERSRDARWWGGEAFWATAERQGARAAIHMWPGSEADPADEEGAPSVVDKYNGKEALENKVARILGLLDLPGRESDAANTEHTADGAPGGDTGNGGADKENQGKQERVTKRRRKGPLMERPQLIAAYVPDVDADGHLYGPNSTEIRSTISSVDAMIGSLVDGLSSRNLTSIVNLIIVSDHGMASTDVSRLLQLEDLIDVSKVAHTDGWPLYGLRPKQASDLDGLHSALLGNPGRGISFDVYLRDVDMPKRWHFSGSERIAPLWIVPRTGWAIVRREEFVVEGAVERGEVYHPRGLHGYDHEHPLMRAIFIARGPAFGHPGNSEMEVFQNIEVYNLVCDSLGVTPGPNNGTLRLPLQVVGTHKEEDWEMPSDPPPASSAPPATTSPSWISTAPTSHSAMPSPTFPTSLASTQVSSPQSTSGKGTGSEAAAVSATSLMASGTAPPASGTTAAAEPGPTASGTPDGQGAGEGGEDGKGSDSLTDKLKGVWDWVKDEFGKAWGRLKDFEEGADQSS